MVNKAILIGRFVRDPELKPSTSASQYCRFSIAVNSPYPSGGQENQKDNTTFFNCVAFKKQAENISKYCKKGDLIYIEGRISISTYQKDGQNINSTSIIVLNFSFLNSRRTSESTAQGFSSKEKNIAKNESNEDVVFAEDIDWGE